jgi:hypothetical protein
MNLVHASLVAGILFPGALVYEDQAHSNPLSFLPALSYSSPRARVLSSSHGISPSQEGLDTNKKHQCINQRSENKGMAVKEGLNSEITTI